MNDPWQHLRGFTAARIALGRAGGSLPTAPLLDFRLSHARAKDAVLAPFDPLDLAAKLHGLHGHPLVLESRALDRATYLRRPDYGRALSRHSHELLADVDRGADLAIVLSDGLSTRAVMDQAVPLLSALLPLLVKDGWIIAPLCIVRHGRVAIQDEVGGLLGAKLSLMLLGERPGLGSPDSLGAYFTHSPRPGRTDADRNCVSNIRPEGLAPDLAARKLHALLTASYRLGLSGIGLKDDTPLLAEGPELL
ncbi:ethanolamine ammonia-lyase subunit EutC [Luteolibacter sp. LG18]|uniref:ethanolamine ammonia-lyase subunit EutC n=1 Tax=Luteolibacter sp. LG18 TaxID=2819286 RepID=UPI002B2F89B8|nr:ethanolamine ammonia-lyase light chain [Luteolibacter sp. LG18]